MKYQLINVEGVFELRLEDKPLRCPFNTRVPLPVASSPLAGQGAIRVQLHEVSCTSECALFKVKQWATGCSVQQRCTGDHSIEGLDFQFLPTNGNKAPQTDDGGNAGA